MVSQEELLDRDFILSELHMAFSQDREITASPDSDQAARIRQALEQSKGKRKDAAELLGIHPSTLWRQMKALGIS